MGIEYPKLRRPIVGMLSLALLVTGLLVATEAAAKKKKDVTFENKSKRHQELLVAFGGDGSCEEEKSNQENVSLDPGDSQVVSSGEEKVCWCAGTGKAKVSACQEWNIARPGKKVRLTW